MFQIPAEGSILHKLARSLHWGLLHPRGTFIMGTGEKEKEETNDEPRPWPWISYPVRLAEKTEPWPMFIQYK